MLSHPWDWLCRICLCSIVVSAAILDRKPETDSDLQSFISRPDLRPPKFRIQQYGAARISPGYWFLSPYVDLHSRQSTTLFAPKQTGPHIFDASGELVWSGAHLFDNSATFDFKTATCHGSPCMTFILNGDLHRYQLPHGSGIVLDSSFHIRDTISQPAGESSYNMHEFTVTKEGTAISIIFKIEQSDVTSHWPNGPQDSQNVTGWVGNNGFREIDIKSGKILFEWWALDHVHPSESRVARPTMHTPHNAPNKPWDFFHQNSVHKNDNGDYLVSSRYLDAIYKISGSNGSIIWQLGGRKSSFVMNNFSFSRQHDARFRSENSTHTVISFLNNAADDNSSSDLASSGMIVSLDLTRMAADVIDQWYRPDQELTRLRGNVQLLPNGNNFVCWSENGRISEFSPSGDLLLDAQFASRRFVTYRGYKFAFVGAPSEPPAIKSFIYGPGHGTTEHDVTAIYVSWNGATEVSFWRFYGADAYSGRNSTLLGQVDKTGFETVLMARGRSCTVYAEAVARDGRVLGIAPVTRSVFPSSWNPATCEVDWLEKGVQDDSSSGVWSSAETGNSRMILGFLVKAPSSTQGIIIGTLECCVVALLIFLGISVWRIKILQRCGRKEMSYDYMRLDK